MDAASDNEEDQLLGGSSSVAPPSATRPNGNTALRRERRCWSLALLCALALAGAFALHQSLPSSLAPSQHAHGASLAALSEPRALAALYHLAVVLDGGDATMLERLESPRGAGLNLLSGFTPPWARTAAWEAQAKAEVLTCAAAIARDPLYPEEPWIPGAEPHFDTATQQCDCSRPVPRYSDCALDGEAAEAAEAARGELRTTVVTALLNIGRTGRTLCDYVRYMDYILRWDVNLVIFVEAAAAPLIAELRNRTPALLEQRTVIHAVDPHDRGALLAYVDLLPEMRSAMDAHFVDHARGGWKNGYGEHVYAEYAWINHAKIGMMKKAMADDDFKSEFFFWADAGFGHYEAMDAGGFTPALRPHFCPCTAALPKKVTMFCLGWTRERLRKDFGGLRGYVDGKGWLGAYSKEHTHWEACRGDMWGGGKAGVANYAAWYDETFRDLLKQGIVDDDQPLMMACAMDRPDLCRIHSGTFVNSRFDAAVTATPLTRWLASRYVVTQSPRTTMFC